MKAEAEINPSETGIVLYSERSPWRQIKLYIMDSSKVALQTGIY